MDETPGLSDQYRKASPWPIFIAFGLVISELGLVFDVFPIAVGGLVLFCGSITGILLESDYADAPWTPLGTMTVLLVLFGAALLLVDPRTAVSLQLRAYAVFASAIITAAAAIAGTLFVPKRPLAG
ncbi:MAG: DUF7541 family protein [Halobacteriota archaeon]